MSGLVAKPKAKWPNHLTPEGRAINVEQQEKARQKTVGGAVSEGELRLILEARDRVGLTSTSAFVRQTMLEKAERILTPRSEGRRRSDKAA
jgi:hypothetical protein